MTPTDEQLDAALLLRFDSDAGDELTMLEYFEQLLQTLWDEGEGFSGKRPFGNSGWQGEVIQALAAAELVKNETREEERAAELFVCAMITRAFDLASDKASQNSRR